MCRVLMLYFIFCLAMIPSSVSMTHDNTGSEYDAVAKVYERLDYLEGEGDRLTGIETGRLGVTRALREKIGGSDEHVAMSYLNLLYEKWGQNEEFLVAPGAVQEMLLDLSYNLGESAINYNNVNKYLHEGNYCMTALSTLDTANVKGRSVIGLAKRRAFNFNLVSNIKIWYIKQKDDGTLTYLDGDFNKVFSYKPNGGKHELSKSGTISVIDPKYFWM